MNASMEQQEMNWDDVHYFVSLVRLHTLTATAEQLGVQHSTVARRIEQLERNIGVRLFDHLGKRYVLTVEGQLLYQQALLVEHQMETFQRMAIDQDALQGDVVLSAPPIWSNQILLPLLHDFRQKFPEIVLHLQGDTHFTNLHQREADIALRLKRPTQDDLVLRELTALRYGIFAHPNYLNRLNNQLDQAPHFIDFQSNQQLRTWYEQIVAHWQGQFSFSSNNFISVKSAIMQEFGIGILPLFLLKDSDPIRQLDPKTLQPLLADTKQIDDASHQVAMYLVMHPDIRRAPRVRAVADWLIAVIAPSD